MTIALSVERVLDSIYAYSAIDYFTSGEDRPSVLGRDNSGALKRMASNAAAHIIFRLTPPAVATSLLDEPDADIITVDFDADSPGMSNLRPALESAVAAAVMSVAWAGKNSAMSDTYSRLCDTNVEAALAILRIPPCPGRIEPAA